VGQVVDGDADPYPVELRVAEGEEGIRAQVLDNVGAPRPLRNDLFYISVIMTILLIVTVYVAVLLFVLTRNLVFSSRPHPIRARCASD
jgi:hypothetical protein